MPAGLYLLVLFLKLLDALADLLERLVDFGCGVSVAVSNDRLSALDCACLTLQLPRRHLDAAVIPVCCRQWCGGEEGEEDHPDERARPRPPCCLSPLSEPTFPRMYTKQSSGGAVQCIVKAMPTLLCPRLCAAKVPTDRIRERVRRGQAAWDSTQSTNAVRWSLAEGTH